MARNGNGIYKPNIKTSQKTAVFLFVQPEWARYWLENHNPLNRPYRSTLEDKYTKDQENDDWIVTDHAISFDTNGHMINGQHTCGMIARTGRGVEHLVVTGLTPAARLVTDIGAPRRPVDILRINGRLEATHSNVAVVRSMMNGTNKRASMQEIVRAYDSLGGAARWALGLFPTMLKKIVIAPVTAVLGTASFTQDKDRLKEFASILYEGKHTNGRAGNSGIYLLRDYLEQLESRGDGISKHIYGLTETALLRFLNNTNTKVLKPATEPVFLLPKNVKPKVKKEIPFRMANTAVVREVAIAM